MPHRAYRFLDAAHRLLVVDEPRLQVNQQMRSYKATACAITKLDMQYLVISFTKSLLRDI